MLEHMLALPMKPSLPIVPNNGPGPALLKDGDQTLGYFGEVDNADFVTIEQIEAQALVSLIGAAANRGLSKLWVKYVVDGKILYIPKRVQRTGISWDNLYAAGFVYGVNGAGTYPGLPTGAVNQLRTISLTDINGKVWNFKIRLTSQSTIDPVDLTAVTVNNSEFSKTVERTWPTVGIPKVWASFGQPGAGIQGIESRPTYTEYCVAAAGNSTAYYRNLSQKNTASGGWLPCLELIPDP